MVRLIQVCVALFALSIMVSAAPCQDGNSTSASMDEPNHSNDSPMNSTGTSSHVTDRPMNSQMVSGDDEKMSKEPCYETICDDAHDIKQEKSSNNDNDNHDLKQAKSNNNDNDSPDLKQVKSNNNDNDSPDLKQVKSTQEEPCDDNDKAILGAKSKVTSAGISGSSVNQLQNGLVNVAAGDHIGTKNVDIRHIISNIASPKSDDCDPCTPLSDSGSQFKSVNQVQSGLVNVAAGDHIGTDNVDATKIIHNVL